MSSEKSLNRDIKNVITERQHEIIKHERYVVDCETTSFRPSVVKSSKGIHLEHIKMKDAGAYQLEGYDITTQWDTMTGKCVFDYIKYRYGDIKGFKSVCTYDNLHNIFGNNSLEDGVNTIQIEKFCKLFKIPMYAIDSDEKTFKLYQPEIRNKKCPAMIYRLSNKHFYPISDTSKIRSITTITSLINQSSEIVSSYVDREKKEEPKIQIENVVVLEDKDAITVLGSMINENKKIPNRINIKNKKITSFILNDNQVVVNQNVMLTKTLCENMKLVYTGQSLDALIKIIIEQAGYRALPKSRHNPHTFDNLLQAKKRRIHAGLTHTYNEAL